MAFAWGATHSTGSSPSSRRTVSPRLPIENSPANAQLLANSAVADFDCAFGAYVVIGGLIGEELDESRSIADRKPFDQRVHTSKDRVYAVGRCDSMGVYTPLQTARVSAERVLQLLESWSDAEVAQRETLIATMHAYAGYATLLLGEGFCTTVISALDANPSWCTAARSRATARSRWPNRA